MGSVGSVRFGTNCMVNKHLQTLPAAKIFAVLFWCSSEYSAFTWSLAVRDLTANWVFQEEYFILFP